MPSSNQTLARARALLNGKRATVMGLAREGLDLCRFLSAAGTSVRVVDNKPASALQTEMTQLEQDGVRVEAYHLGGDTPDEALDVDVVYASPGVPPEHPFLERARARGVEQSSLIQLFFALSPAPIVGITGSAGKTTTTSLTGEIFRAGGHATFVGGNIGRPLLGELTRITQDSWVVLELSSFQLESLRQSPTIAVITNVTPNHLDRHGTMESYWAAKGQLLDHQASNDSAVLNADDAWSQRYVPRVKGRLLQFSLTEQIPDGAYLDTQGQLVVGGEPLLHASELRVPGRHNVANVLAACLAAHAAGVQRQAMVDAIRAFTGVAHRLQVVADLDGVRYVDDSIATAPERSMAALAALEDQPVVLIAGGRDKHLPMDKWAAQIVRRARHVVLLGEMSDLVREALRRADPSYASVTRANSMDEAVTLASRAAKTGDVVLLSPGGTSYDMYKDFEERGADFLRAVETIKGRSGART